MCRSLEFHPVFADSWLFGFASKVVNQTFVVIDRFDLIRAIIAERIPLFKADAVDNKFFSIGRKSEGYLE